jgi:hypothetical protein
VEIFWGLFWGPPAFENRDFLVILPHFRTSAWLAYAPFGGFPGPRGVKMGKRAGSRSDPGVLKTRTRADPSHFYFCGKVLLFWGLFWGPPAFENRDFLVIHTSRPQREDHLRGDDPSRSIVFAANPLCSGTMLFAMFWRWPTDPGSRRGREINLPRYWSNPLHVLGAGGGLMVRFTTRSNPNFHPPCSQHSSKIGNHSWRKTVLGVRSKY